MPRHSHAGESLGLAPPENRRRMRLSAKALADNSSHVTQGQQRQGCFLIRAGHGHRSRQSMTAEADALCHARGPARTGLRRVQGPSRYCRLRDQGHVRETRRLLPLLHSIRMLRDHSQLSNPRGSVEWLSFIGDLPPRSATAWQPYSAHGRTRPARSRVRSGPSLVPDRRRVSRRQA